MGGDDGRPSRGRPPGPSLSKEAVAILERNAFTALRGPNSRGAVPRGAFAKVDVSTVDRAVKRKFGGESGRTPFDLASYQVCASSESTTATMEAVFAAVEQSFRTTDAMEETLRVFLKANFTEACNEDGMLAASLVTTAACAHLKGLSGEEESKQTDAAGEIMEMWRKHNEELIAGFAAGLTIALRRLRRRPKLGYSVREIVIAVMASTDGFVNLYHLQPDFVCTELVVDTQWGIIWSLSEPGLLDPPTRAHEEERALVEAALALYSSNQIPSLDALCIQCDVPIHVVRGLFPDSDVLAQRCMEYAVGSSVETEAIAVKVKGAELSAVRDLLIATTRQASISPLLIDVVRRNGDSGFCAEARRHIAEALTRSSSSSLDSPSADGVALMLLDAAMQGDFGRRIWEAGLNAFAIEG